VKEAFLINIISAGIPHAVPLNNEDVIECQINGFLLLKNALKLWT
jgi:hypothetical protein